MIFYYKHKSINDLSQEELNLLGYDGVLKYAEEHGMSAQMLFEQIKQLELEIQTMGARPFDMSQGSNLALFNEWTNKYIDFFNNNASYNKQAYIILGNIASGKSTFAKTIEQETGSIIIDPDRFKMGESTKHGFFEGFTSLYHQPTDRERLQDPCSDACKQTLRNASDMGMNIIMPKSTTSTILLIVVTVFAICVIPLGALTSRIDKVTQEKWEEIIEESLIEVSSTGKMTRAWYQNLQNQLSATWLCC